MKDFQTKTKDILVGNGSPEDHNEFKPDSNLTIKLRSKVAKGIG